MNQPIVTPGRVLVALIVILAISVYWTRASGDEDGGREPFTASEARLRERLARDIDALLPRERDLEGVLAGYFACESGYGSGTDVTLRDGEVARLEDSSVEAYPNKYVSFCTGGVGEIGMQVLLPRDRTHLRHFQETYDSWANHTDQELELLAGYEAESLTGWGEVVESRWVDTAGIGDHSSGYLLTVADPESDETYYFAGLDFTRGIVMGSLHVFGQMGADRAERRLLAAAASFDDSAIAGARTAAARDR